MGASVAFASLLAEQCNLTEGNPLLRDYLRIMGEREPAVCGMVVDTTLNEPYIGYFDEFSREDLAAWSQILRQQNPHARFFLWRNNETTEITGANACLELFTTLYYALKS